MLNIGTKSGSRQFIPLLMAVLALGYIGYHAIAGKNGMFAYIQLATEIEPLKANIAALKKRRAILELQVSAISDASAESDIIDSHLRFVFNATQPQEVVIMRDTPLAEDE